MQNYGKNFAITENEFAFCLQNTQEPVAAIEGSN